MHAVEAGSARTWSTCSILTLPYSMAARAGGYLEYVFRAAARELFGADVPPGPLPLRALRNADLREVALEVDGRPALRFAAAYGFRNIQTLARGLLALPHQPRDAASQGAVQRSLPVKRRRACRRRRAGSAQPWKRCLSSLCCSAQ